MAALHRKTVKQFNIHSVTVQTQILRYQQRHKHLQTCVCINDPEISVSARPGVNTDSRCFWLSTPWKDFYKTSVFRDLKHCLHVYGRWKYTEKALFLRNNCICGQCPRVQTNWAMQHGLSIEQCPFDPEVVKVTFQPMLAQGIFSVGRKHWWRKRQVSLSPTHSCIHKSQATKVLSNHKWGRGPVFRATPKGECL